MMKGRRKFFFIVNPVSGKGRFSGELNQIVDTLATAGSEIIVEKSKYNGHAAVLAGNHPFEKDEICVSFGGDGTFNEVASALAGSSTPVAVMPYGSGNGLARSLKIKHNLRYLKNYLLLNKATRIDAGTFLDKFFFCTCGIGFDALVAAKFNARSERGLTGYIRDVLKTFFQYRGIQAEFVIDGVSYSGKYFLVTFANAPQYGNDTWIAPGADMSDGLLDVVMVRSFPLIYAPLLAFALFGKFIRFMPMVEIVKASEIEITMVDSSHFHYDGESTHIQWPLKIKTIPGIINVLK
jgi:diacylglycerol kinase (ATP)